jgi:hypothetical protein
MGPDHCEGIVHRDVPGLRDGPLRLFDDDPAVQRHLQLFGQVFTSRDSPFLQQTDGGDVGQRLDDLGLRWCEITGYGVRLLRQRGAVHTGHPDG